MTDLQAESAGTPPTAVRRLDDLRLGFDVLGGPVSSPILRIGSGKPHVALVALQHGDEIGGLDSALSVIYGCEPIGALTLVAVASPPAFADATRQTFQHDPTISRQPQNLNRLHPGDAQGTAADRMASALDTFLVAQAPDLLIDLHASGRCSVPHVILDHVESKLRRRLYDWCNGSRVPWYEEFEGQLITTLALDRALSAIWCSRATPAVTLELGPTGAQSSVERQQARHALTNMLVAAGAIRGHIQPVAPQILALLDGKVWGRHEIRHRGATSGFRRILVDIGEAVVAGQLLAEVVRPDGTILDGVTAEAAGVVMVWEEEWRLRPGAVTGLLLVPST